MIITKDKSIEVIIIKKIKINLTKEIMIDKEKMIINITVTNIIR
jgi:hypothetical protein